MSVMNTWWEARKDLMINRRYIKKGYQIEVDSITISKWDSKVEFEYGDTRIVMKAEEFAKNFREVEE